MIGLDNENLSGGDLGRTPHALVKELIQKFFLILVPLPGELVTFGQKVTIFETTQKFREETRSLTPIAGK